MHFKLNTFLFIFCIVISSCKINDHNQVPTININPDLKTISCSVSEILSNIKIVHLETTPNNLIGYFSSLIFVNAKNIIYKSENRIIIFNHQGKFLNKIDRKGKGPEEYENIINVFVDPQEEYIFIVDYKNVKIYNFEGKFIKSLMLDLSLGGVYRKNNGELVLIHKQLYNQENRNMISILDSSFNIFHTFESKNSDVCNDVNQNLFFAGSPYQSNNRLYYLEPFVDTIFEIADTMLIPHWHINHGNYGLETKDGINTSNYEKARKNKISFIGLRESEKYFFIDYDFNKAKFFSVYDKNQNRFIFHRKYSREDFPDEIVPTFGLNNDIIKNGPKFWPNYISDSICVCVIPPNSLTKSQQKDLNCNPDDNPILLIGNLR